jgi:hypothetical protein
MKRRELLSLILAASQLRHVLFADAGANSAVVVVIGTIHKATQNFTEDDVVRVLKRVGPAAILFELDSSFLDADGQLDLNGGSLEGKAVKRFQRMSPVVVLPYDIAGRNQIYRAFRYFEREKEFLALLNTLYREDGLAPEAKLLYEQVLSDLRVRDALAQGRLELFNSVNCDLAVERKHERYTKNTKRIIELTPALARFAEYVEFYAEFWELRNRTMVRNILRHSKEFPGRVVVVLCGFEHRYYLTHHLKAAEATGIDLREFWEVATC